MMTELTSVYIIGTHSIDQVDYESGISDAEYKNLKLIRPFDEKCSTPNGIDIVGPVWSPDFSNVLEWGVPIKDEFMPKEYYFKGPVRPVADFTKMWRSALVSQKFKDLVEAIEPNVHQFFEVKAYWPGKKPVEGRLYWFHVCNTLDSVNEQASDLPPRRVVHSPVYEREIKLGWRNYQVDNLVFNTSSIGNCHIWQDKFLSMGPWGSDVFKKACDTAQLTGISMGDANKYRVA